MHFAPTEPLNRRPIKGFPHENIVSLTVKQSQRLTARSFQAVPGLCRSGRCGFSLGAWLASPSPETLRLACLLTGVLADWRAC